MERTIRCVSSFCALLWATNIVAAYAETPGPLNCRYVKADSLIKCSVLANEVAVTGASVNDGKCRSPLEVFEANKLMMKRSFGVDMDGVASFVRSYNNGDEFSMNVDKGCAVYRYSVQLKDAVLQFGPSE